MNKQFFTALKKTREKGTAITTTSNPSATPAPSAVVGNGLGAQADPAQPSEEDDIYAQ